MRTFQWRGREWTLRPATEIERETFQRGAYGALYENLATIIWDDTVPEDLQIQTILHEIGHVLYPEWEAEPNEASKSELGILERDLKAVLEELSVDLSPLIEDDDADAEEDDS